MKKRKGFTLAELVTAVAILAMLAGFISVIFKSSVDGYRSSGANTEIMQKLRAITDQLNTDFEGLCKDGYLIISKQNKERKEFKYSVDDVYSMDRIYYFTTGDFQSWDRYEYEPDKFKYAKSNIARVFWGHDSNSLIDDDPLSECRLLRDIVLLTPSVVSVKLPEDCRNLNFALTKNEPNEASLLKLMDPNEGNILANSFFVDIRTIEDVRRLFCENIGEFRIEWTYGDLVWDPVTSTWMIKWLPNPPAVGKYVQEDWKPNQTKPKALKFTFTLYDSKGILQGGRRFTHIVYLDN